MVVEIHYIHFKCLLCVFLSYNYTLCNNTATIYEPEWVFCVLAVEFSIGIAPCLYALRTVLSTHTVMYYMCLRSARFTHVTCTHNLTGMFHACCYQITGSTAHSPLVCLGLRAEFFTHFTTRLRAVMLNRHACI